MDKRTKQIMAAAAFWLAFLIFSGLGRALVRALS